jgi:hypothetical protein
MEDDATGNPETILVPFQHILPHPMAFLPILYEGSGDIPALASSHSSTCSSMDSAAKIWGVNEASSIHAHKSQLCSISLSGVLAAVLRIRQSESGFAPFELGGGQFISGEEIARGSVYDRHLTSH